ncbi:MULTISPECIES: sensor histidine kinase [unclassified Caulobacter]|uniref:sensor histidine kinase n=1 Tax=unclassified Caulobacter TaxID=2648921 RepID=UPI0006FA5C93|nr:MULTISPECIES: histidine kinase dimerization/phosphoacceptor domain -containing protein [unclassified Caulobacter]KQV54922.1 histidine kinase [Caulobacter sp. Root342]KQV68472.1 histidine kinase [Caulobacter sp. Root343]
MDLRRRIRGNLVVRYGLAVALAAGAVLLRFALTSVFPPGFPYVTFFPAILVATYYGGLRAGVVCAALCGVAAWWFFIPPVHTFKFDLSMAVALAFYVLVAGVEIFFIDGMRTALDDLEDERERYRDLAESRDLLYRELHHRVSNNLQVAGALLRLQGQGVVDARARQALSQAGERIEVIARIQRELHNRTGEPVPFRAFAEALLASAAAAAGARVRLTIEGGEQPLHPDQATPVTLVMLESFNNALEHGFGEAGEGEVRVTLDQSGLAHVLTVGNDGAGPPPGFDPATSKSLGLRIVRAMAQQLGGKFEMAREDGWTVCRLSYAPKRD